MKIKNESYRENLWDLVENKMIPSSFPTTIGASTFTTEQFKIHKLKVQALVVMAVKDEFTKTIKD